MIDTLSFFNKITENYTSKKPFVAFRKPNEELVTLMTQKNSDLYELGNFEESGFVFIPFQENGKKVIFPISESEIVLTSITQYTDIAIKKSVYFEEKNARFEQSKKEHIDLVGKGVEFIKEKKAQKIVLSRKEVLSFSEFNMIQTFKKMLKNYINACVYVWFHPEIGLWMGATPERLLNIKKNNFITMALAGTQPFIDTTDVVWKEKEKEEQQFVTDYILNNIKANIELTEVKGPYTIKAGSLLHLRTDIIGQLKASNSLESLIKSLHPTPAVCGLPKEAAVEFIQQNENYKRTYYAGYFGELNINNSSQLFVNLRCMEIKNSKISIFIGGGITLGSVPENEFDETVAKAMVMKKVL